MEKSSATNYITWNVDENIEDTSVEIPRLGGRSVVLRGGGKSYNYILDGNKLYDVEYGFPSEIYAGLKSQEILSGFHENVVSFDKTMCLIKTRKGLAISFTLNENERRIFKDYDESNAEKFD